MRRTEIFLACVVLLCSASSLFGSPETAARASAATRAVEAYSGTIVSLNGQRYVLRDEDDGTWYNLDDQQVAAKFAGRKVLVVGRLDTQTDVIHVEQIQDADSGK